MSRFINLTDRTFNQLKVVSYSHKNKHGQGMWNCVCECGSTTIVLGDHLRSGHTQSCGCLHEWTIASGRNVRTHGMSGNIGKDGIKRRYAPEYTSWQSMKARCYNHNNLDYPNYGERGIKVCIQWYRSFEQFYHDMGPKPSPKHSLDRIDNNGHYAPGNCRWATPYQQRINQRPRSTVKRLACTAERCSVVQQ